MQRSLQTLAATALALVAAVVPAWAGTRACAAMQAGMGGAGAMACCLPSPSAEEPPCCAEPGAPPSAAPHALDAPGCDCRVAPGDPTRPATPQQAETAVDRELRARVAASVAGLAVMPAPAPELAPASPLRAAAARLRAPPPGRARSAPELLSLFCVARR